MRPEPWLLNGPPPTAPLPTEMHARPHPTTIASFPHNNGQRFRESTCPTASRGMAKQRLPCPGFMVPCSFTLSPTYIALGMENTPKQRLQSPEGRSPPVDCSSGPVHRDGLLCPALTPTKSVCRPCQYCSLPYLEYQSLHTSLSSTFHRDNFSSFFTLLRLFEIGTMPS